MLLVGSLHFIPYSVFSRGLWPQIPTPSGYIPDLTNVCGFLFSVPPDIDDDTTSSDVVVNEGDDTSLECKARGHPKPRIVWLREDKDSFPVYDPTHNQTAKRLKGKAFLQRDLMGHKHRDLSTIGVILLKIM